MLLLATLAYPGGVAGDVSEAVLAGAVVGTFVGSALLCAVLVAAGCWYYTRKRRRKDERSKQRIDDVEAPNTSSGKRRYLAISVERRPSLWSPYGIGQTIIFSSCFFLLSFFFFYFLA